MDKFRDVLKRRIILLYAYIALMVVVVIGISYYSKDVDSFQKGFAFGVAVTTELVAVITLFGYRKALKNEEQLENIYIEEHDERRIYICSKIGAVASKISLVALSFATVIAGFIDAKIFYTLLCVLFFMIVSRVILEKLIN